MAMQSSGSLYSVSCIIIPFALYLTFIIAVARTNSLCAWFAACGLWELRLELGNEKKHKIVIHDQYV